MSITTPYQFGQQAYSNDAMRAPALDAEFLKAHVADNQVGESVGVLAEWLRGYDDAHQADLREQFPEMYK